MIPSLRFEDMASYLVAKGWTRQPNTWRGAVIWADVVGNEVLLPPDDVRETQDLAHDLLRRLNRVEGRSVVEIAADIASPHVDRQAFRVVPGDVPSGHIGLRSGITTLEAIRHLVVAAARSEVEGPRHLYEGKWPGDVKRLVEHVWLGQTAPGSYIWNVHLPVTSLESTSDGLPLVRRAGERLFRSLTAIRHAIDRTSDSRGRDLSGFDAAVEEGASANLCSALSEFGGKKREHPFDVTFTWARAIQTDLAPGAIQFHRGDAAVIDVAARRIAESVTEAVGELTGVVEAIYIADGTSEYRWRAKVRGDLMVPNAEPFRRLVWVRLDAGLRAAAEEARDRQVAIRVRGRLRRTRNRLELHPEEDAFEELG